MPSTTTVPEQSTIAIQVRDHEYAPWRDVEVRADYTRDHLGLLRFELRDGTYLRPVHDRDARRRNPGWTRGSLHRRWIRVPS